MEELPHVLWAHRTMIKSSNRDTLFSLTCVTKVVIPAEIGIPTLRTAKVDLVQNNEALEINLDLLEEQREQAAIRKEKSKAKMEKYYNSKAPNTTFKPGDLVYRNNDARRAKDTGKLGPKWEGPYEVTKALEKGAYTLRDRDGKQLPRTWNVSNLKKCYIHKIFKHDFQQVNKARVMSSNSHATITYTLMSSYEVIVNGYFGIPIDPLDLYAPPSPDYILGPEYPVYLPPADDVLPAEEQPLPATVSLTAESPGYITDSEPEMEPEEDDGDDEKSEGDSIEYPTSRGDDDADDDGDDFSEDDADDEDEEESSDSEDEEEEHLAPTVPTPALHSSIPASKDSDETEPFEDGKTASTPPPFGYRVAARITVQPHILIPFRLDESIPEADIPLRKRARFTTPTGGYKIGESSVAAAARQIRPTLTVADRRRADDRLIGRLRSWTTASHERFIPVH
nr:reverse transcriptase domain-containing protein [Tanacetum cinerariifolium]